MAGSMMDALLGRERSPALGEKATEKADMSDQRAIEDYNYATFDGTDDFLAFRTALPVGTAAPDVAVVRADTGESVQLSDFWRDQHLLIEFGSLT